MQSFKKVEQLSLDALGTTYDPLKAKNKARAIDSAIKAAKRAAASLRRRHQRSAGVPAGEWVYLVNGEEMTVDQIIDAGLISVVRARSSAQIKPARASLDSAIKLEDHIVNRLVDGL